MIALFSATLVVSAALLFWLQPMFGKFLLPTLGSTPQVWIASMLFFQAVLLAGYAYGHVLTARLSLRRQALTHIGIVAIALVVLPVSVPDDVRPPESGNPVWWQLGFMALAIGLPFFALSSTAPLVQRWLASTGHRRAADPYFLYRASNAGSIAGLVAYPALIEPLLGLEAQGSWWTVGYVLLVLLMAGCAVVVLRSGPAPEGADVGAVVEAPPGGVRPVDWRRRGYWVVLAFVPSSLMLGATTYITRDIAPVPLLWVLPLAAYLLSFVVAFAPRPDPSPLVRLARLVMPVVAVVLVYAIVTRAERPLWLLIALHLVALFTVALVAHGALAGDRPHASKLTEFYLWVAVGGALGGVFNALIAPALFPTLVEYPLAIALACALYPGPAKERPTVLEFFTRSKKPTRVLDWVAPVLVGVGAALALLAVQGDGGESATTARAIVFGLVLGIVVNFARRPRRFGAAIAAVFLAASVASSDAEVIDRERSFFGIYRVEAVGDYHEIYDGTTVHGVERFGPGQPEPLSYYHPRGPIGDLFRTMGTSPDRAASRTAIVGLGAGGLACYSRPGERWTFYEIDPDVARIARDPDLFTYLRDCEGEFDVKIGDGRQSLADEPRGEFGLIMLDAFNSDAVPVHLLTREALRTYADRLRPGGLLVFNISNRYVDLEPVLGNLARDARLACATDRIDATPAQQDARIDSSRWAVMAREPSALARLGWRGCRRDDGPVWTDDFSNVLGTLRWG